MNIIYEDKLYQYQSLVLPKHQRTLTFNNKRKLVKIPKSIVTVCYDKEDKLIYSGYILDFGLNYELNFNNNTCTNEQTFKNIKDYVSWYWNSKFEKRIGKHKEIPIYWLRKCDYPFYCLAKFYQPNKLEAWKKLDQDHIQNCAICKAE